jgi:tRNA pseudouridine38-40 synthase
LGGNQDTKEVRLFCLTLFRFDARKYCDSRKYEYIFPSFMLDSAIPCPDFTDATGTKQEGINNAAPRENIPSLSMHEQKSFRCANDDLETLRRLLAQFNGLHKFHNYSSGFSPASPDAKRYIIESTCELVILDGQEYVRIRLNGQSFILNQIRNMVSCLNRLLFPQIAFLIAAVRFKIDDSVLHETLQDSRMIIPRAPGLGLFMDEPIFDSYNFGLVRRKDGDVEISTEVVDREDVAKEGKYDQTNPSENTVETKAPGRREAAGMSKLFFDEYFEEVECFKEAEIYNEIIRKDREDGVFAEWTGLLDRFVFLFQLFGSKNATITKEIRQDAKKRLKDEGSIEKLGI